ncbi:MAG: hypothetical protein HY816_19170 [Candidatus Wallbacteria bacterium]|nr:hypothetical protein [Candidatus Wallbacteria bacterium]
MPRISRFLTAVALAFLALGAGPALAVAPSITSVTYSKTPNAYRGDDNLVLTATFDQDITPTAAGITITGGPVAGTTVTGVSMTNPSADLRTWLFAATVGFFDSDGPRTIEILGANDSGEINASTPSNVLTIDNTPPSVDSITYSKSSTSYRSVDILIITATFDADITPTAALITITGGTVAEATVGNASMANPSDDLRTWLFTATISAADSTALRPVEIYGADLAGNSIWLFTVGFAIDNTAPTLSSVTYSKTPNAYKGGDNLVLTATFDEDITPTAAAISITGGTVAGVTVTAAALTNPSADLRTWLFDVTVATTDSSGTRTVEIVGTDAAGNANLSTPSPTFTIDTTAPTISTLTYSKTPNAYKGGDNLVLTATFDEDISPTAAAISITGSTVGGSTVTNQAMTNPSADLRTWLFQATIDGGDPTGTRTVQVSGADAVGNRNASTPSNTFTIDITPPGAPSLSLSRGPAFLSAGSLLVTAQYGEDVGSDATPTLDATPSANLTLDSTARQSNQVFVYTLTVGGATSEGGNPYDITVSGGQDVAGNPQASDAVQTGVVDTTAPVTPTLSFSRGPAFLTPGGVSVSAQFTEDIAAAQTPTLAFSPSANFTINSVSRSTNQLFVYSVTVGGSTSQGGQSYTATLSGGKDPAGNTQAPATQSGTVDTMPPTVSSLTFSRGPSFLASGPLAITAVFIEPLSTSTTPTIQFDGTGAALVVPAVLVPVRIDNQTFAYATAITGTSSQSGDDFTATLASANVFDTAGNVQATASELRVGKVDTMSPQATLLTYSKASRIYRAESLGVTAAFNEEISPTAPVLAFSGGLTSTTNDVTGTMSILGNRQTWTFSRTVAGGGVDDGGFALTLTAADQAGNPLIVQPTSNTLTIDTVAPQTVAPLSFSRSPDFLSAGALLVTAAYSEPLAADVTPSFDFTGAAAARFQGPTVTRLDPQLFTFLFDVSGTTAAAGDAYVMSVIGSSVKDPADNTQTSSDPVTAGIVDTVPLTATLSYSNPNLLYRAQGFTVTAVFSEDATPSAAAIEISGGSGTSNDVTLTQMDQGSSRQSWSFFRTISGSGPDDGSFTITLTAFDPSGNGIATQPSNRTFTIDTVAPPTPTLTFGRGPALLGPGSLSITADIAEDLGDVDPTLRVTGAGAARFGAFSTTRLSPRRFLYATTVSGTSSQGGDAYSVALDRTTVTDVAGNTQSEANASQSGVVDTASPTAVLTYSIPERLYPLGPFAVTATFAEEITPGAPTLSIAGGAASSANDVSPATPMTASSSRSVWTFSRSLTETDDGVFTLTLAAADSTGNALTVQPGSATFVVDTVAPAAPVAAVTQNAPPTVDRVAGSAETGSAVRVYASSAKSQLVTSGTAAGGVYDLSIGSNTNATVFVTATDRAGNEGPGTAATNDVAPPAPPSLTVTQRPPGASDRASGTAEAATIVRLYSNAELTAVVAGGLTAGAFDFSLGDNTVATVFATATDSAGNESASTSAANDIVAPTAPSITLTQSPPGTADRVSGSSEIGSTVRVYATSARSTTVASASVPAGLFDLGIGDNANAAVFVTATDSSGNESATSSASNDIAAPAAPIVTVTQSPPGTPDRVGGTAEAGSTVRVYSNAGLSTQLAEAVASTGTFDFAIGDNSQTAVFVTATDAVLNVSPAATGANDIVGPAGTLAFSSQQPLAGGPLRITATFQEPVAAAPTLSLTRAGGASNVTARPMTPTAAGNAHTYDTYLFPADGEGLLDDSFSISVAAVDRAGNPSTTSASPRLATTLTFSIPLSRGLNLISLAARPPVTLTASALAARVGARYVARATRNAAGASTFEAYVPTPSNLFPDFDLLPGQGYVVDVAAPATLSLTGAFAWTPASRRRTFFPGANLLGLTALLPAPGVPVPAGPTAIVTAGDLHRSLGASYVAGLVRSGRVTRFIGSLQQLPATLPILSGTGYVVSIPAQTAVTLELPLPVVPGTGQGKTGFPSPPARPGPPLVGPADSERAPGR